MADYNKQTVAQLRNELKERGIPSTGLTRKAQIIQRLEEHDKENNNDDPEKEEAEETVPPPSENAPATLTEDAPAAPSQETETRKPDDNTPAKQEPQSISTEGTENGGNEVEISQLDGAANPAAVAEEPATQEPLPPAPQSTEPGRDTSTVAKSEDPAAEASVTASAQPEERTISPSASAREEASMSAEPSRLNSEELAEERRKRKRRSATPPVSAEEVARKKQKQVDELAPTVRLQEDDDYPMKDATEGVVSKTVLPMGSSDDVVDATAAAQRSLVNGGAPVPLQTDVKEVFETPQIEEQPQETKDQEDTGSPEFLARQEIASNDYAEPREGASDTRASATKPLKDNRYKSLLNPTETASPSNGPTLEDEEDDAPVSPAYHPATPALYIRNLMRPLQPQALRNHLIALASPPNAAPDPAVLTLFHLDPIRTHAFALFSSTTAAARARNKLHQAIWPPERDRKPLFADFVPDEQVGRWIEAENDAATAGPRALAPRFEVVYETGPDGEVAAIHQRVGAARPPPGGRDLGRDISGAPKGPRGAATSPPPTTTTTTPTEGGPPIHPSRAGLVRDHLPDSTRAPPSGPRPLPTASRDAISRTAATPTTTTTTTTTTNMSTDAANAPLKTLDELFRSTTAKPKLYYLPAAPALQEARLHALAQATSRGWRRGGGDAQQPQQHPPPPGDRSHEDALRRFGFEDGATLVDRGEHWEKGEWKRRRERERGFGRARERERERDRGWERDRMRGFAAGGRR